MTHIVRILREPDGTEFIDDRGVVFTLEEIKVLIRWFSYNEPEQLENFLQQFKRRDSDGNTDSP